MSKSVKSTMDEARQYIGMMNDTIKTFDETIRNSINGFGFGNRLRDVLGKMSAEDVKNLSADSVDKIVAFTKSKHNEIEASREDSDEKTKAMNFTEYCISIFTSLQDTIQKYNDAVKERDDLMEEMKSIAEKTYDSANSTKRRKESIAELQKKCDEEADPTEKARVQKILDTLKKREDFSFLTDRIYKFGNSEVKNIINSYFDSKRSSLIKKKFDVRFKRLGYTQRIYKMFVNLEEMFLPEEYYPLNGIFFFLVERFISYADTTRKEDNLFCQAILVQIHNLVYHRFSTPEEETEFIEFIKKTDDNFMPFIDIMKEKNVASPLHPARIAQRQETEAQFRQALCDSIVAHGGHLTDDVVKMELPDLKKHLDQVIADQKKADEDALNDLLDDVKTEVTTGEPLIDSIEEIDLGDDAPHDEETQPSEESAPVETASEEITESVDVDDVNADAEDVVEATPNEKTDEIVEEAETSTDSDDAPMIVTVRDPSVNPNRDLTGIRVYADSYGDLYIPNTHGEYSFYDSRDGHLVEDNVSVVTVLQLASSGSATKKQFKTGYIVAATNELKCWELEDFVKNDED